MQTEKRLNGPRSLVEWAGDDRVTLVIVNTDIVGSTVLGVELGDERMDKVRLAHFKHSDALLARYGGQQVKTMGDAVLAVFRSVRSALDYALALHLDPGVEELRLRGVRAGIHVGEVHVVENDVHGIEDNFAARVVHAIEGAEIWLSGRAREAIERAGASHHRNLEWQQHDDVELKGLGKYPLWSLVAESVPPLTELSSPPTAAEFPVATGRPPQTMPNLARNRTVPSNGRTVFVARPAEDMGQAYVRILHELKNRGFTLVPDGDIPKEDSAVEFIASALAASELSIHLLGEKRGYAPAEEDPIVRLQLRCAARRSQQADKDEPGALKFRRLIWAPKVLEDLAVPTSAGTAERDPLLALERFGELIPGDKIVGENLIQFITFLQEHFDQTRPRAPAGIPEIVSGAKIFIDHHLDDCDYANELFAALQELSFEPKLRTLDGKPREVDALNRREMLDCAVVALCWGSTTEAWIKAEASKLDGWRRQARRDQLEATLLAVPPSHKVKERWLRFKLPGIDRVVNMTANDKPSPADLDKWLGPRPSAVRMPGED